MKNVKILEVPTLRQRRIYKHSKDIIRCIILDKDETYMLVGVSSGDALVYSLPQKDFVRSKVETLQQLGF